MSKVGETSSVSRVTTPRPPSATTAPAKRSPSSAREIVRTVPSAVTISIAATREPRKPFRLPEPCVAVAQAPATVMCGSEAVLCNAKPAAWTRGASRPYVTPPSIVICRRWASTSSTGCRRSSEIRSPVESAIALKEWREPSTRTCRLLRTISCTWPTVSGWCTRSVLKRMLPAQLRSSIVERLPCLCVCRRFRRRARHVGGLVEELALMGTLSRTSMVWAGSPLFEGQCSGQRWVAR